MPFMYIIIITVTETHLIFSTAKFKLGFHRLKSTISEKVCLKFDPKWNCIQRVPKHKEVKSRTVLYGCRQQVV